MTKRRDIAVAVMVTFFMTVVLFSTRPINSSSSSDYDPWYDVNHDGKINLIDTFGVALKYGTSGTPLTQASIQYDSGWIDITDKCGQNITILHSLNSKDIIVDITGKTTINGGPHQMLLGGAEYTITWNRTYGNIAQPSPAAEGTSVVQTSDGGYAFAGAIWSDASQSIDFLLVKIDRFGNVEWQKTFDLGYSYDELADSVIQTSDGGFLVGGSIASGPVWLVKTDSSGNVQWTQTYSVDYLSGIPRSTQTVQTNDEGFAVCAGHTLIRTDVNGNTVWTKTYSANGGENFYSVVQTSDRGFVLAGCTGGDFWLVKTDSNGDLEWNRTYGGVGDDHACSVVEAMNGGYALAGYTNSFGAGETDCWLVKTDLNGNMLWNKTYGGAVDEYAHTLIQTNDGGYLLAGNDGALQWRPSRMLVIRTDWAGKLEWQKEYTGAFRGNIAYGAAQTRDNGYVMVGLTMDPPYNDPWLAKTDTEGNIQLFKFGLAWVDSTANDITLYRGSMDPYWNYVRVQVWQRR